jgi:hypothetical protein
MGKRVYDTWPEKVIKICKKYSKIDFKSQKDEQNLKNKNK